MVKLTIMGTASFKIYSLYWHTCRWQTIGFQFNWDSLRSVCVDKLCQHWSLVLHLPEQMQNFKAKQKVTKIRTSLTNRTRRTRGESIYSLTTTGHFAVDKRRWYDNTDVPLRYRYLCCKNQCRFVKSFCCHDTFHITWNLRQRQRSKHSHGGLWYSIYDNLRVKWYICVYVMFYKNVCIHAHTDIYACIHYHDNEPYYTVLI